MVTAKLMRYSLFVLILVASTLFSPLAYCADQSTLYVDPPSIIDYSYAPGTIFSVAVALANVSDLRICEFNMTYNSTIVGFLGMLMGPLVNEPVDTHFGGNDEAGDIWFNVTYEIPVATESPIIIATIHFIVKTRGETLLDIYYGRFLDSLLDPLPFEALDGYFNNFNPYDVNHDGIVDLLDFSIIIQAFGSSPGHPRWNPLADVDHNNIVDLLDFFLIVLHFGEQ